MNSYLFFFSIAITLFYFCLNSLDLLLNIEKLKSFIFPDCMEYSTLSLLISVILEVLYFILKILSIILGSFLIESFYFDNTLNSIQTKLC